MRLEIKRKSNSNLLLHALYCQSYFLVWFPEGCFYLSFSVYMSFSVLCAHVHGGGGQRVKGAHKS